LQYLISDSMTQTCSAESTDIHSQPFHEALTGEERAVISEELKILAWVQQSLASQLHKAIGRHVSEQERSRELTSELVAAHRDEDKAMLASDEAVAHAMSERAFSIQKTLEQLLKKPYFARFVLREEDANGQETDFEYKLGFHSNPENRIVDWRKGPISKLYYEYREGDYYDEEIQGRSRSGEVVLRRSVEIVDGVLLRISTTDYSFSLKAGVWQRDTEREMRRAGRMRNVQALITPDQFRLITEEARTAVLLQGIAGSGKTTVALHRLAWMLHNENSDVTPENCLVLVLSPSLGAYVRLTLEHLELPSVPVLTFAEWKKRQLSKLLGRAELKNPLPHEAPGPSIRRYKQSLSCLLALRSFCELKMQSHSFFTEPLKFLEEFFFSTTLLSEHVQTDEFLSRFEMDSLLERFRICQNQGVLDYDDETLLICAERLLRSKDQSSNSSKLAHLVIDEVQDYNVIELAAAIGSTRSAGDTTLVGDASQSMKEEGAFIGWEKLRSFLGYKDDNSQFLSLTISHRSTLPIMQLADVIQLRDLVSEGRSGRTPIWFQCLKENSALSAALDWLGKAQQMYPDEITAVICENATEAREVYGMLQRGFGQSLRLGTSTDFRFDAGVVVTDLSLTRGLEFFNVLVWNASKESYPDDALGRNKLYIAATRAEENLCFISYRGWSRILATAGGKLRRVIEKPPEE
jgi:DNA helicase IV